jgi:signal transduction histidine kinase
MNVIQRVMEGIGTAEGLEKSTKTILSLLKNARDSLLICADQYWPSVAIGIRVFNSAMFDLKKRKVKCRFITEVTKDNIAFCKELLRIAEVRHLPGLKGNFAVNENEYIASSTMKNLKLLSQVVYSNSIAVVEQHHFFFENLWDKSMLATEKIDEMEKGIVPEVVEVIKSPSEIQKIYCDIIKSSTKEILLILTTHISFTKEGDDRDINILQLLTDASNRGVIIKIIIPREVFKEIDVNYLYKYGQNIEIRSIDSPFDSGINILVVDTKYSLIVELKVDAKIKFIEAARSAVYSTTKPKVLSLVTIFDILWKQTDLYEKLKDADRLKEEYIQKLKLADKIKDEFVNVAAHELRTPTQSILTFTNLLKYDTNKDESIEAIQRNARRLNTLIKNILDVTKIEGNKLVLYKDNFNLNDLLILITKDYREQLLKPPYLGKNIKLLYELQDEDIVKNTIVYADKERITQVISNLIDNSIKFIGSDGLITVTLCITKSNIIDSNTEVEIIVKDTGSGISEDIIPYLFTKFQTRSFQGTGLGLFISKNIIECHGGNMFARNNKDGKGATFLVRIPILSKDIVQKNLEVDI